MEIIKDTIIIEETRCPIPGKPLFVDIETLGLQAARHAIYLIGTASFISGNTAEITLLFAENTGEEADILSAFLKQTDAFDTVVTYNGTTFDLPFLAKRCARYGLSGELSHMASFDLYTHIKKRKSVLHLPGCRQKDIEAFLEIGRIDEMNGGELIDVYKQYEKHPSDEAHSLLIRHNLDDVRGMLLLLPMLTYEQLSEVELQAPSAEYDSAQDRYLLTAKMNVSVPKPVRHRTDEYYLILDHDIAKCAFTVHDRIFVRYFWDNPKNYVYLLREERIVPKLLAKAIPKAEKRPVSAEECYSTIDISDAARPADEFLCGYLEKLIRKLFR